MILEAETDVPRMCESRAGRFICLMHSSKFFILEHFEIQVKMSFLDLLTEILVIFTFYTIEGQGMFY